MAKKGRKKGTKLSEEHKQAIRDGWAKSTYRHSEETKKKMSESKKGNDYSKDYIWTTERWATPHPRKGKPLTEEWKENMRKPKSVPSHRKGKKWLDVNGQRVWFTPREYEEYLLENPDASSWGNQRQTWRVIDGKRKWMTLEEAKKYDQRQ